MGRAALALSIANVAASLLNYLFQVHAVAVLDAAAFGLLSSWLARVTVIGAVATVVQFVSLDYRLDEVRWARLLRIAGVASFVVVGAHLAFGVHAPPVVLGASAVIGGVVLYAIVGQLQARLQLGVVAASILGTTVLRFAAPFGWIRDERAPAFYMAHAAAMFAGVAAAATAVALRPMMEGAVSSRSPREAAPTTFAEGPAAPNERRLRLGRPILLAFATVLFPLIDILVIGATQDAATTGAFSRVALAARVVFFAGAAALQVLLPHQLHAAKTGEALPSFALRIERWLTPAMLGGAALLALIADHGLLHTGEEERTWLYASCLGAALLVAILGHVNRLAARDELGVATACVIGVVVTSAAAAALAAFTSRAPVTGYVLAVLGGDALVLLGAGAWQMRARPSGGLR